MKFFVVGITAIILLASCSSGTSPSELYGTQGTWELTSLGQAGGIPDPENYTLQFSDDGNVNVKADCNRCFGGYQTQGNAMTIGPLGCTLAACGPDSLFDEYIAALTTATAFSRQADGLEIDYSGGIMSFRVDSQ